MGIFSQFRVELVISISTFNPLVWLKKGDKLEPFPTWTVMDFVFLVVLAAERAENICKFRIAWWSLFSFAM